MRVCLVWGGGHLVGLFPVFPEFLVLQRGFKAACNFKWVSGGEEGWFPLTLVTPRPPPVFSSAQLRLGPAGRSVSKLYLHLYMNYVSWTETCVERRRECSKWLPWVRDDMLNSISQSFLSAALLSLPYCTAKMSQSQNPSYIHEVSWSNRRPHVLKRDVCSEKPLTKTIQLGGLVLW